MSVWHNPRTAPGRDGFERKKEIRIIPVNERRSCDTHIHTVQYILRMGTEVKTKHSHACSACSFEGRDAVEAILGGKLERDGTTVCRLPLKCAYLQQSAVLHVSLEAI